MSRANLFQNVITGILTLSAVVVTLLLVRREFFPAGQQAEKSVAAHVRDWRSLADAGHRAGPPNARVTIVEFSDFQCPFCRIAAARLDSLRRDYSGQVAVVYRHYPLEIHPHAVAAAHASECAAEQDRFWAMHDALFEGQDSIGKLPWNRYASAARVPDTSQFETCMAREQQDRVEGDRRAGGVLGVNRTPTLLVNGTVVEGAVPLDTLRTYVERVLRDFRDQRAD